jgi:hypothetical protein
MILLVSILSFVLSFVILYVTRFYLTRGRLLRGDTFFHLLVCESIRNNRGKFPSTLQNVMFSEIDKNYNYLAYPPLFHYIIALFPTKFHQKIAEYFSIVMLSFVSTTTAIFVYTFTSELGLAMFSAFIVVLNFSALSLVVQFSPRPLGLIFYSLIVCLTIFLPENPFLLLAISLLVALVSLTHKFAVQALTFGFLPFIFVFGKPYFLLSFVLGFLLSIIISKGFYLRILEEQIRWLRFYKDRPRKTQLAPDLASIFGGNVWILQIAISILFVFFQSNGSLLENLPRTELMAKVIFWAFINILIALLVSISALSFLGEYNRYVEYSMVSIAIAASVFMASLGTYILIVSFACVGVSLLALLKFRRYLVQSKALVDPGDVLSYLSLRDYGLSNLLVFPSNRTLEVCYYSGLSVIHPVRGANTPSEQITNLTNNYEIRYVLRFKGEDPYQLFATIANTTNMKKIADFKNFELYRIAQEKT